MDGNTQILTYPEEGKGETTEEIKMGTMEGKEEAIVGASPA